MSCSQTFNDSVCAGTRTLKLRSKQLVFAGYCMSFLPEHITHLTRMCTIVSGLRRPRAPATAPL